MVAAPGPAHDPGHDDDLLVLAPHEQADPDVLALAGTQLKKNEPLYMADILKNVLRHIQRLFLLFSALTGYSPCPYFILHRAILVILIVRYARKVKLAFIVISIKR